MARRGPAARGVRASPANNGSPEETAHCPWRTAAQGDGGAIEGGPVAGRRNHRFSRSRRACQNAAKTAPCLFAKQGKAEDRDRMATFRAWAGGATP
jgi:hypothetical protein